MVIVTMKFTVPERRDAIELMSHIQGLVDAPGGTHIELLATELGNLFSDKVQTISGEFKRADLPFSS